MTDPLEYVTLSPDITLSKPVLVAAFRGWNDAGDAASFAALHLGRVWSAETVATIDPEEFYDFQAVRPQVELIDGETRRITWPSNEFSAARLKDAPHDVLLLIGTEPNTKWRTFSSLVVAVAKRYGVELVITLGALLAEVPHSRPVPITGTAVDAELIHRLGLARSRYEGPTGIVGVLHDAFREAGIDSASLWAAVPHYLAVSPNPKAALALVQKAVELIEAPADVGDLVAAADEYDRRVTEVVAGDEDVQAYVRSLEERSGEYLGEEQMPSGDSIAAELERYLRDRSEGS